MSYCKIEVLQKRARVHRSGKPHILMVRGRWQVFFLKKMKAVAARRYGKAVAWCHVMNYPETFMEKAS